MARWIPATDVYSDICPYPEICPPDIWLCRTNVSLDICLPGHSAPNQCPSIYIQKSRNYTGCPKKQVTLFVKAIIFKPRIASGWYYAYFEADPLRLKASTHT